MPISFFDFIIRMAQNPLLFWTVLLTGAVLIVNGWTDAPNAIAGPVATGLLPFPMAVALAAACNFLGVLCISSVNISVAETIYSIASFDGSPAAALTALCSAMAAVILWATAAWYFGIPTSESHALIAGISGAAVAFNQNFDCIHWIRLWYVLIGLLLSVVIGFAGGFALQKILIHMPLSHNFIRLAQIPGAAAVSFLHGAQDGQKFLGIFLLGVALAEQHEHAQTFAVPIWLIGLCAAGISLGTLVGGRRIIDTLGHEMVHLSPLQSLSSDWGCLPSLIISTWVGFPISTTHTRTAALLGANLADHSRPNRKIIGQIVLIWLLTIPGCAIISYILCQGALILIQ